MEIFILQIASMNERPVIGVYSTREKAQDEADNHAASTFGITKVIGATPGEEDLEIRAYGARNRQIVNYSISKFIVDSEALRIQSPFA
jgi:hypothetical protein